MQCLPNLLLADPRVAASIHWLVGKVCTMLRKCRPQPFEKGMYDACWCLCHILNSSMSKKLRHESCSATDLKRQIE